MTDEREQRAQALAGAFQSFTDVSERLARTYWELERRVSGLTEELAAARSERFLELAEKARIANRLERLLAALPAGVIVVDEGGIIQETNRAACALLQRDSLVGLRWDELAREVFVEVAEGGHDLRLNSGTWINLSVSSLGAEPGQIVLLHDVTSQRDLQDSLHRARRLSAMGEMLASLAHQVRTPLSAALLYTSQLARNDVPDTERRRFAQRAVSGLRHLESMVNDLLLFAKGGTSGDEAIELGGFVAELQPLIEQAVADAGATWTAQVPVPLPLHIGGSRAALLSVFHNLVMNALQASASTIELVVRADNGRVELALHDNGSGVPETVKDRLFEPFFTTRANGTGLGLAVARAIVLAHRGEIALHARPAGGTSVVIQLPLRQGEEFLPSGTSAPWTATAHSAVHSAGADSATQAVSGVK